MVSGSISSAPGPSAATPTWNMLRGRLMSRMSSADSLPLIRVEHLSKTYPTARFLKRSEGQLPALHDVSFDIAPGETLGLVGHSGSGKTTAGRAILRLIEPTGGRVTVRASSDEAINVTALGPEALRTFRRHMQMVFQDPYTSLNPRLSIQNIVEEPLRIHHTVSPSDVADRARQLLERVGLDRGVLKERPGTLSGGQRQRVGIARAIATDPCFVVADEPVTALDVSVQAQILNLLRDLQDELGLSYLFISHDLAVVEQMSDRIAVLSGGLLVEIGATAEILNHARHPHTQTLARMARRAVDA